MDYFILGLAYAIDPIILLHVCYTVLKPKYNRKIYYILITMVYYLLIITKQYVFLYNKDSKFLFLFFPLIVMVIAVSEIKLYYGSIKEKVVIISCFIVISSLIDAIICGIFSLCNIGVDSAFVLNERTVALTAISRITDLIVYMIIGRILFQKKKNISVRTLPIIACYVLSMIFILLVYTFYIKGSRTTIAFFWFGEEVTLILLFAYYMAKIFVHKDKKELFAVKKALLLEKQIALMDDNKKVKEELRELRHDMRAHLKIIKILNDEGRHVELQKYMNELYVSVEKSEEIYLGENAVLESMINSCIKEAKSHDILFEYSIMAENIGLSLFEQGIVFSNILNNAIEANITEDKKTGKFINLSIHPAGGEILIICSNSFFHILQKKNNTFLTNKQNKKEHGIGIHSIKKIVTRNGGTFEQWVSDNVFYTQLRVKKGAKNL